MNAPSEYLIDYLESQGMDITKKDYITSHNSNESIDAHLNDANVEVNSNNETSSNKDTIVNENKTSPVDLEKTQYLDVLSDAEEL